MPNQLRIAQFLAIAVPAAFIAAPATSIASLDRTEYLSALSLAEKKVERLKQFKTQRASVAIGGVSSSTEALSTSALKSLLGRSYKVGDQWDVIAFHYDNTAARATSDPKMLEPTGRSGVFHYEVLGNGDQNGEITLRVTQKTAQGLKTVDSGVESVTLTMGDEFQQTRKQYKRPGGQVVNASPDGLHTSVSVLELYPLDIPDVVTAERLNANTIPSLPGQLAPLAKTNVFNPDLSQCSWFEQDDFFGRPVQVLWQHGDPWPAYLRTVNGVAILIHKDLNN